MKTDLSFKPVSNTNPKRLTPAQVAFYNEQGYLKPFSVYSPREVERNRTYFDYMLAELRVQHPSYDSYAINGYHTRCKTLFEMVTYPATLDLVEDIVGPNIIAWGTHFFCKIPGDPKRVHWHQDASYWPLTPARTVTVWLAIDDADVENSCMQFLPGTHRLGHLKWQEAQTPGVLGQEIINAEQYGQPVADELKAGELSLHADMLAHGSAPNKSTRRRCGLTIRYCPPEVEPLHPGWADRAILCRGVSTSDLWKFPPKPTGENITDKRPEEIGGN